MPSFVSPGVYTIEKDISEYSPSVNPSVVGIVGFASKGPTNKATLITNSESLVNTFGKPAEAIYGQGLEGAIEILETTNSMYFVRAADSTAQDASSTIPLGSCPAVAVSSMTIGVDGGQSMWFKVNAGNDDLGVSAYAADREVLVTAGTVGSTGTQYQALRSKFGGSLAADKVGVFADNTEYASSESSGIIAGKWAGSGAWLKVEAYSSLDSNGNFDQGASILQPVDGSGGLSALGDLWANNDQLGGASSIIVYGGQLSSTASGYGENFENNQSLTTAYEVESIYPGTGYNEGTTTGGDTSGNSVRLTAVGGSNINFQLYQDGVIGGFSEYVSLVNSGAFVENVINTGETDLTNPTIKGFLVSGQNDFTASALNSFVNQYTALGWAAAGDATKPAGLAPRVSYWDSQNSTAVDAAASAAAATQINPRFVKMVDGTYSLAGGTDGADSSDTDAIATALIGSNTVDPKTGMQALDDDLLNISMAAIPGVSLQTVQNNLITLAQTTQNFLAVVSPPYGVGTVQDAIDWTNGLKTSRSAALNNSYAACYWPWVKTFDVFDGKDRWYDPAIYGLRQMAFTDGVADAWFAPAGFVRGKLTKPSQVEVKCNQGDRDSMYSGGNILNPIVNFPQQGITIFGQRTTQRDPTALDRVNIRRLMIYIRKQILASTRRFVFEPNDSFTWERVANLLNPMLEDIKQRRGITQFRVVCDETTNTPLRVDRNEMWCKVLVKPTKTAEVVVFEINLTNQSAQLG